MRRAALVLGLYWLSVCAVAQDLTLHIAKNRIGYVQAYLENTGKQVLTVPTGNLLYQGQGDRVEVSPKPEYWQRGDTSVMLKTSPASYSPVTLRPGEITYLKDPNIRIVTKVVQYRVPEDWAALHGTWSGEVEATVHK